MTKRKTKTNTKRKKTQNEENVSESIRASVVKKFGSSSAVKLSDDTFLASVTDGCSTQCLSLDLAIGRPGLPAGRISEISGLEAHGKSTIGVHLLAEAQRRGGVGILVDSEWSYDPIHVAKIGIDPESLIVLQPKYMEQVFDMFTTACKAVPEGLHPVVCVWDSVASTPTMAEVEGKFDERFVGIHARVLGAGLRKMVPYIADRKVVFVCINQLRDNIDRFGYGEKYKTFGGHALRFHCAVRIQVRKKGTEKRGGKSVGLWCGAKVIKNKVGPPYREADFYMTFDRGIDRVRDLIDLGVEYGVLSHKKGSIAYGDVSCRPGRFKEVILPEVGGLRKFKKMILKKAVQQEMIKPYGV